MAGKAKMAAPGVETTKAFTPYGHHYDFRKLSLPSQWLKRAIFHEGSAGPGMNSPLRDQIIPSYFGELVL